MSEITKIIKIFYELVTFRYSIIKKMLNNMNQNDIYKDIIQEELEFYDFYKLTGIYMRSPKERKKYINAYNKNKEKIDLLFKEFVSMKEYLIINDSYNIEIDLKKTKMHYLNKAVLSLISILIILIFYLKLYIDTFLFLYFIEILLPLVLFMFLFIYLNEPYENAKKIKELFNKTE